MINVCLIGAFVVGAILFCATALPWFADCYSNGADETNLSLFNTTSDQASTYPMLVGIGLMPPEDRLKFKGFEVLAFLPRFLPRRHPDTSTATKADLKRRLTWLAINHVLAGLALPEVDDFGYRCVVSCFRSCPHMQLLGHLTWCECRYLGTMRVGRTAVQRDVYLLPMLYIAGMYGLVFLTAFTLS